MGKLFNQPNVDSTLFEAVGTVVCESDEPVFCLHNLRVPGVPVTHDILQPDRQSKNLTFIHINTNHHKTVFIYLQFLFTYEI